jgi:prevent-host-death family protein
MARQVSVRDLRNHTADVVRAVEAGNTLTLTVNRRPVADIIPHDPRSEWAPAAAVQAIATDSPADRGLLDELRRTLGETIDTL